MDSKTLNGMLGLMRERTGRVPQSITLPGEVFDALMLEWCGLDGPATAEASWCYNGEFVTLRRGTYRNVEETLVWHAEGSVPPVSGLYLVQEKPTMMNNVSASVQFAKYDPNCAPDVIWQVLPTESYKYSTSRRLAWAKVPLGYTGAKK